MKDFAPIGQKFFDETAGAFTSKFDAEFFSQFWAGLIESGVAVVFGEWKGNAPAGAIGGVLSPDPCNGAPVMMEVFWFVDPEARGNGIRLFKRYMEYAETVSERQTMVHLISSMPEKLEGFYLREGFERMEVHYSREG